MLGDHLSIHTLLPYGRRSDQPRSLSTVFTGPKQVAQFEFHRSDRVAPGRCRPRAPTDPYVLALEHTVLQIRGSLHDDRATGPCKREAMGSSGRCHRISPRLSNEFGPGDSAIWTIVARLRGETVSGILSYPSLRSTHSVREAFR